MYQVIHHYTKIDNSQIYDVIMEMIERAQNLADTKKNKPGFVNMRGIVSEDGLTFSVTQFWESKESFDLHKLSIRSLGEEYTNYLETIGVKRKIEESEVIL